MTREIELTRGRVALVDDDDYERVVNHGKWCLGPMESAQAGTYYGKIGDDYPTGSILMHRFIMGLEIFDKRTVDHINHNRLDNRKKNLRICSMGENSKNKRKYSNGVESKYKGVGRTPDSKKYKHNRPGSKIWRARIRVNGELISIGNYSNERDAAIAYNSAATKYFGEFANLNEVSEE